MIWTVQKNIHRKCQGCYKESNVWHNLEIENKNEVSVVWIHVYNKDVKLAVK